jgi:hypothetical protein
VGGSKKLIFGSEVSSGAMAVAHETFDRLRITGLAELDPDVAPSILQPAGSAPPGFKGYTEYTS